MLADFIKSYMFEKLDKQIAIKIPYCLFIAVVIFFASSLANLDWLKQLPFPFIIVGSFAFFLLTSIIFNRYLNRILSGNILGNLDLAQTVKKMRSIYDGKASLLDDFNASKNAGMIVAGFLSGILLCIYFVSLFLALLYYYPSTEVIPVAGVGALFLMLYFYYDAGKSPLQQDDKQEKNTFLTDLFQVYAVKNSLKKIKRKSEAGLYFVSRLLGPLANLQMPKFAFRTIMVYENPALDEFIENLLKSQDGLIGKQSGGESIPNLLTAKPEKITLLIERSQLENFPYLLNPDYKYPDKDDHRKWTAVTLFEEGSEKEKVICRIFIHKHKAFFVKRYVRNSHKAVEAKADPRDAFLFFIIGERSQVEYLLTKIELVSTKVPTEILNYEFE